MVLATQLCEAVEVYHVELRKFPHSFCRFNLSEQELRETILSSWARGDWVQAGDRRWSPQEATLAIIEGPQLAVAELAMGRGWRNARRRGQDVTAQLIADASRAAARPPSEPVADPVSGNAAVPTTPGTSAVVRDERKALVDSLALELLRLLGDRPVPLAHAWLLARERHPDRTPSECLALAEAALEERR